MGVRVCVCLCALFVISQSNLNGKRDVDRAVASGMNFQSVFQCSILILIEIAVWSDDICVALLTKRTPHSLQFLSGFGPFTGTWDEFFQHLQAGKLAYGDQLSWLQDWDKNKQNGDILFLKYEDMKDNTLREIRKIIAFLGLKVSEKRIDDVIMNAAIGSMRENPATNLKDRIVNGGSHIRRGEKGEWRDYFTKEQNEWFDAEYEEGFKKLGIDIVYE